MCHDELSADELELVDDILDNVSPDRDREDPGNEEWNAGTSHPRDSIRNSIGNVEDE